MVPCENGPTSLKGGGGGEAVHMDTLTLYPYNTINTSILGFVKI